MKTSRFLPLLFAVIGTATAQAGLVGLWEFNDPADLGKATIGSPLALTGSVISVPGTVAGDGAAATDPGDFFTVTNPIGPNGSSGTPTRTNTFTLVMDFKVPVLPSYSSLFDFDLTGNGDYFISKANNQPELGEGSFPKVGTGAPSGSPNQVAGTVRGDIWYRLVLAVDNGVAGGTKVYLNGVPIGDHGLGTLNDVRRSLGTTFRVFDDPNGIEEATTHLSRLALYDTRLDDAAILALGNTGAVTEPFGVWDGGGDGVTWTQAANWSRNLVPGSTDDVVIDVPGTPTILVGSSVTVKSITCAENLSVTGGTFKVLGPSGVAGAFQVADGAALSAEGVEARFETSGSTVIHGANLTASAGGKIVLGGVLNYQFPGAGPYGFDQRFLTATGTGSEIRFPDLIGIAAPQRVNIMLYPQATGGGRIVFEALEQFSGSLQFISSGAGSRIEFPELVSGTFYLRGTYAGRGNGFVAADGGTIDASSLDSLTAGRNTRSAGSTMLLGSLRAIENSDVILEGTQVLLPGLESISSSLLRIPATTPLPLIEGIPGSTLEFTGGQGEFPSITNIDGGSVIASGGAVVKFPSVSRYRYTVPAGERFLSANGAGSRLEFPGLSSVEANSGYYDRLVISASGGGIVWTPLLEQLKGGVHIAADGAGSRVEMPALVSAALVQSNRSFTTGDGFYATNGGRIFITAIEAVSNGMISFSGVNSFVDVGTNPGVPVVGATRGIDGPLAYRSFADSPFREVPFTSFHLEDGEDGAINTPGVTFTNHKPGGSSWGVRSAGTTTDSVDGDDGNIDGGGSGGKSLAPLAEDGSEGDGVTVSFQSAILGYLPTHAGFVWTDGSPGKAVLVEFYDGSGAQVASIGPVVIADGSRDGTAADDHFFGAVHRAGIGSFRVRVLGGTGTMELDHVQYGTTTGAQTPATPRFAADLKLVRGGPVNDALRLGDGSVVAGGAFSKVNGQTHRSLVKVAGDGNLAAGWATPLLGGGSQEVPVVTALAADATRLFVGGDFAQLAGAARPNLCVVTSATGAAGAALSAYPDRPVVALAVDPVSNSLHAATSSRVFRYNLATTSPISQVSWPSAWVDAGERIESVLPLGAHLYVAGRFDSLQGQARTHLARVNALTGAVDATWNPSLPVGWHVEQILTDGVSLFIRARDLAQPDRSASLIRKLNVAGAALDPGWTAVSGMAIADAMVSAPFLYVADRAGSLKRFALADGALDASWSAATEGHATALAAAPDGLLAFGPFRAAAGAAAFGAVKLDLATAAKSADFTAEVTSAGSVHAMALQTDGKVLLGGDFQEIQGKPVLNFARLEAGSDRFDPAWAPVFAGGAVRVIDVSGHEVHIGGDFIRAGTLPVSLARFTLGADDGPHADWLPDASSVTSLLVAPDLIHVGARFPSAAGDRWLGRMARLGNGAADPGWSPLVKNDNAPVKIKTMAAEGEFLYFGGEFTSVGGAGRLALARVGLADGQVSTNWNPNLFRSAPAVAKVEKLIVRDGFVYLAGDFNQIQGKPQNHLARLALVDADFDVSWRPSVPAPLNSLLFAGGGLTAGTNNLLFYQTNSPTTPARVMAVADGPLRQILAEDDRVLAAGAFSTFGGIAAPGFGAAALTGQARVVFSGRFVHFYPDDSSGAYANGFKMDALTGGLLVDPATGQQIVTGGTVTMAQGAAGLLWLRNPDATAQEIKVSANGGSSASDLDPATVNPVVSPGFSFSQTTITVREGEMASPFVEYQGTAQIGTVAYEILPLTAAPFDGLAGDYVDAPVRVNLNVNPRRGVFEGPISIPVLEDGTAEAPEEFYVRLIQPGGGIPLGRNTLLKVIVIDNPPDGNPPSVMSPLLSQAPSALPVSAGASLTVNLSPATPGAKWRLWGEPYWRDPGTSVALLQGGGRHRVEYRPLDGYKALLSPDFAFLTAGQAATLTATYQTDTDLLLDGEATVEIWPPAISEASDPAARGQWRVAGETTWRDGGSAVTLTHGKHLIEFKEGVAGWIAPGPRFIDVAPDGEVVVRAAYTADRTAAEPAVLPFSGPGSIQSAPFHFVGQIESSFGYATGTAVSEQVVLTAARAMWNPETLGIATRLAWFHQQDSSQQRAVPRGPRNVLIRAGYAAERAEDESEGTTPGITGPLASDRLDAAVMYFLGATAARGGYSGYLADFTRTPAFHPALLDGSSRLLCGYPVSGIPAGDRGRMHASLPATAPLASMQAPIYRSAALEGRPGMEGAPLMAQHANGSYYPAAIYLGESGGAVFRAIDRHLAQLIYRAEAIANTLSNGGTGGGDEFANRLTGDDYPIGFVTASLVPGQGRWRALDPETGEPLTGWFFSGEIIPLVADRYVIAYEPVGGLANPLPVTVEARSGQLTPEVKAYYPLLLRYEDWRTQVFSPAQLLDPLVSGPAADPDGDGFDNRMEFGLGLPPLGISPVPADVAAGRPGTPYFEVRRQAGIPGGEARFTFLRRYETDVLDIDYQVEFADSPAGPWTLNTTIEPEYGGVDQEWQAVAFPLPLASERRARFGRIRVIPRTPPAP